MVPPNLARKEVVPFRGYALGALVALYFLVWVFVARGLPSADKLLTYQPPLPTMVRGADGEIVRPMRANGAQLRFVDFPEPLINAFLSAEDKTFWTHGGIDYTGLPARCSIMPPSSAPASARGAGPRSPSRSPRTSCWATNTRSRASSRK
jgi:membrane carboxypeptidase/penicillin-binding protein